MYYAHFILNKKGPLAKIWLAAHWDKKLTKAQIYETNIESTIEAILEPQMKLALRTSGHLLLGVCRIYSRKVKYLLADCNEAFVKIKLAFRPGLIDLPKEKQQASVDAITLPEKFPDFLASVADIDMEELNFAGKNATQQQARVEDITLKEDFGTMITMQDDDFGDMGSFGMDMDTFMMSDMERGRRNNNSMMNGNNDVLGGEMGGNELDFFDENNESGFSASRLKDTNKDTSKANEDNLNDINPMDFNNVEMIDPRDLTATLENPQADAEDTLIHDVDENMGMSTVAGQTGVVPTLFDDQPTVNNTNSEEPANKIPRLGEIDIIEEEQSKIDDENDENAVNPLPPATVQRIRNKKRHKIIIDDIKEIDSNTMKTQLSDTRAILGSLELAPPTRKLMLWKETGGVDRLLTMTCRPVYSKAISKLYSRNMVTKTLADITNIANKSHQAKAALGKELHETSKIVENYLENQEASAMEAQLHDQLQSSRLPLADSFLDTSKRVNNPINNSSVIAAAVDNFDDQEHMGGPGSVFNPTFDDMLEQRTNLEMTPAKDKKQEGDAGSDEDGSPSKTKSPKQKRMKKKSLNLTANKENTTLKDDMDDLDETVGGDPSKALTKRAKTMITLLNRSLSRYDNVGFTELTKQNATKTVVQKFYSLLVLTKYEIIEVSQDETYGEIIISKGEKFDSFTSSQQTIQA